MNEENFQSAKITINNNDKDLNVKNDLENLKNNNNSSGFINSFTLKYSLCFSFLTVLSNLSFYIQNFYLEIRKVSFL